MKEPELTQNGYRAGKFVYTVDGNSVIVTRDAQTGLIESIAVYTYSDDDRADSAAYRMARLQANA